MKKILVCVLILSAFFACKKDCEQCKECDTIHDTTYVPTPIPDTSCKPNLTKGLIAYFPFNGNFNDESGNGNNVTAKNGAALTTDFLGRASSAAGFDGVDDYLIVPGSSKLNSDSITVSFQIMASSLGRPFAAVSRINFESAQSCQWNIHVSKAVDTFFTLSIPKGTDRCDTVYNQGDTSLYTLTKGPIKANRWYNVVFSFGGGVQKMYVDGVLEATKTRTNSTKVKRCDNSDLIIGGWWKSDIMSLNGKMDEVRLYNRVLNPCEIAKLANSWN